LQGEQDDDGEQQPVEGERADPGQEAGLVPGPAAGAFADTAGQVAGSERDSEEDRDDAGDLAHAHVQADGLQSEPAGQQLQVEVGQGGVAEHLEQGV
jgi:hypothetical protein